MQIVNGYVCQTSCDVAAVKKGHDPKNPHDDPVKAAQLAASDPMAELKTSPQAVQFGGSLTALSVGSVTATASTSRLVDRLA
jgi:hypothetical protein